MGRVSNAPNMLCTNTLHKVMTKHLYILADKLNTLEELKEMLIIKDSKLSEL